MASHTYVCVRLSAVSGSRVHGLASSAALHSFIIWKYCFYVFLCLLASAGWTAELFQPVIRQPSGLK